MRRTSSRRSLRLHPGHNGRCNDVIENSKARMSRYLDSSTKTQMVKIMVQHGRPSRSSWAESVRSFFGRTIMGKAIRENPFEVRLGKGLQIGNVCSLTEKKAILVCVCGRYKNCLERNKTLTQCGKCLWKTLLWENQLPPVTTFLRVALNENAKGAKIFVDSDRHMFESRISARATANFPETKATWKLDAETISSWSYDM